MNNFDKSTNNNDYKSTVFETHSSLILTLDLMHDGIDFLFCLLSTRHHKTQIFVDFWLEIHPYESKLLVYIIDLTNICLVQKEC